MHLIVG